MKLGHLQHLKFWRGNMLTVTEKKTEVHCKQRHSCRRLPLVTAYSTPLTTMDKTRARRDMLCPYLKIKLTEPMLNNSLDKYFPPFRSYIFIYLYTNIYTYMILQIFK